MHQHLFDGDDYNYMYKDFKNKGEFHQDLFDDIENLRVPKKNRTEMEHFSNIMNISCGKSLKFLM